METMENSRDLRTLKPPGGRLNRGQRDRCVAEDPIGIPRPHPPHNRSEPVFQMFEVILHQQNYFHAFLSCQTRSNRNHPSNASVRRLRLTAPPPNLPPNAKG